MKRHSIGFVDSSLFQHGRYALDSLMVKRPVTHALWDSCKRTCHATGIQKWPRGALTLFCNINTHFSLDVYMQ